MNRSKTANKAQESTMKIILLLSISLTLCTLFTAMPAHANSKCTAQKHEAFEARRQLGMRNAVAAMLRQDSSQEVLRPFADITIAEQQMVIWGCLAESDRRLLLRGIRIKNQMDVYPAAFKTLNHILVKELGVDLLEPQTMFNTTIYLENK